MLASARRAGNALRAQHEHYTLQRSFSTCRGPAPDLARGLPFFVLRFVSAAHKEIEHVPAVSASFAVQFGVTALAAGDGDEFLVLDIKQLGKISAGRLQAVGFILLAAAFGA